MFKKLCFSLLAMSAYILSSCSGPSARQEVAVLPTPVQLTTQSGAFVLKNGLKIGVSDESLLPAAQYLQTILQNAVTSTTEVGEQPADLFLKLTDTKGKEGAYKLNVTSGNIVVEAADYSGIISAISTLRQLLPAAIEQSSQDASYSIPAVSIEDAPRLAWRGMMLDASRHFWNKEEVKHVLDMMALYKLNKFHWHLTDDQGWRIEIKKYPLLTEKGAWRKFNSHDRECMRRMIEEDNMDFRIPEDKMEIVEGDTLYGGYYTQDDIKEIVAYAAQRGIDVIPEIDMPGHFLAAINQYPEIACTGLIGWGSVFSSPICSGKDSTLEFCKNVYKEVFQLFPYKYVHMGGDEVDMTNWKKCADCQHRMKHEGVQSENGLQAWFVRQMEAFFTENGKKFIGWDEVISDGLSDNATIMWWRSWAPKAIPTATSEGKQVINTENNYFYFDYLQDKTTLPKLLAYDPIPAELTPEQQKLVLGVQANFWCEWISSMKRLEYMMTPRLLALSEIAWVEPSAKPNIDDFYKALIPQFKRLDAMNINYRIPDLEGFYNTNAFVDEATLNIKCPLPDAEVRYTTDGKFPTKASQLYEGPLKVTETTEFTLRTFRPDGSACDMVKTKFVKAPYAEADGTAAVSGDGLNVVWHDFKGEKCADIDTAPVKGTYMVETVSIPEGVKGDIGLVLKGYLQVPVDGIYTLALLSDDGSTLLIDGKLLIDNDGPHSPREVIAQVALKEGLHPIEIRYFDNNGGMLEMSLINEKGEKQILGKDWLKH